MNPCAIGDVLGCPVEFIYSFEEIQARYGERGITRLDTTQHWLSEEEQVGKAVVSDDTQMALYTANGLLNAKRKMMAYSRFGAIPNPRPSSPRRSSARHSRICVTTTTSV